MHEISNNSADFDVSMWDSNKPIKYFGMPDQPKNSGSCGMGVILSVKSIMDDSERKVPRFDWAFADMQRHRALLLKQLVVYMRTNNTFL